MLRVEHYANADREDRAYTFEVRADTDGDGLTFDGIASVVDRPYTVRDMFGEFEETIAKGAFNRTIKQKDDVRLLVNHDGVPMARTKSGTLTLTAEPDLRAVARLAADNPTVQEVRSAMLRGDIDQMSIGFRVRDQEWNEDYTERQIREVELLDVSVVTYPANVLTSAALRSLTDLCELTEADPGELRRAIAHLQSLLPAEPAEERTEVLPVWADLEYQLLAKRHIAA